MRSSGVGVTGFLVIQLGFCRCVVCERMFLFNRGKSFYLGMILVNKDRNCYDIFTWLVSLRLRSCKL